MRRALPIALDSPRFCSPVDAVFCSDLQRAFQTAEIAFAERGLKIIPDSRLRECDYGELTQSPVEQIDEAFVRYTFEPFQGGESVLIVVDRVRKFLSQALTEHEGETVVVIGHRATKYALGYWSSEESLESLVSAPGEWREVPIWRYELDTHNLDRH